jgi:hypothetical protein
MTVWFRWMMAVSLVAAMVLVVGCPGDDDDSAGDDDDVTGDDDDATGDDDDATGDDDDATGDDDDATGDDDDATADDDDSADDDDDSAGDDDDDSAGDDDDSAGDDDDDTMGDDDDSVGGLFTEALVATVDGAFSTGTLATIDLDTHAATHGVGASTTDTYLAFGEGTSLVMDGPGFDQVTAYDHPDYAAGLWDRNLSSGANPRAAAVIDGTVYVVQYGRPQIKLYEAGTGNPAGQINLNAYADADGNTECATTSVVDGMLYVACQRLDATWQPSVDGGILLKIDPATDTVVGSWTAYGGLTCRAVPGAVNLICHEGVDFDTNWLNVYDGAIFEFDTVTETFGPDLLDEATLAANLSIFAFGATGTGLLAAEDGSGADLLCADLNAGTTTLVAQDIGWIVAIEANERGEAYVLNRSSWSSGYAGPFGVSVYDLATCAELGPGVIDVGDEPYKLTFVY